MRLNPFIRKKCIFKTTNENDSLIAPVPEKFIFKYRQWMYYLYLPTDTFTEENENERDKPDAMRWSQMDY